MTSDLGNELLFTNSAGKIANASAVMRRFQTYDDEVDFDILITFDCCWSFSVKRTTNPEARRG